MFKDNSRNLIPPRFLDFGKDGHRRTIEFVAAAKGEIQALPLTRELKVDDASAEVAARLHMMNALGGQAEDALHLAAVDQPGITKTTAVEGAVYAVVSGEPRWKVKLKDYLKYSPEVKKWRPTMAQLSAAPQSEEPPIYEALSSIMKDLPIIEAALPEVECSSLFQVSRGASGRIFGHFAARAKNDPSQNDGKNPVEHLRAELGVLRLDALVLALAQTDQIEGLKDVAPEPPMRKFVSFTRQAVELVTRTRITALHVYCDPLLDASLSGFLQKAHVCNGQVSPAGSGFKFFEQLIEISRLAKALLGAVATIVPTDPNIGFSDDDAAVAADHSVGAFFGLLTQCEAAQEANPQNEADIVKDAFMRQLAPETEALKRAFVGAKRAALEGKFLTENESVPLSKLKGGLLGKDWRDGIRPSIAFDGLLECDQSRRASEVEAQGKRFLGMGVSGGAEGARKGPAFFPGGTLSVWEDIRTIIEAAAAKASDGRPCVTMCGSGGAGSCVKMYHNAGEYAVLQIWAEAYAALRGLGLGSEAAKEVFASWKARGPLDSYMLDITIEVAGQRDAESADGSFLVDNTADMIGSKGTGLWSVQVAMDVGCPVPSLAQAVLSRQVTMARAERQELAARLGAAVGPPVDALAPGEKRDRFVEELYWATYLSIIASYCQMFQAIRSVDKEFRMGITENLPRIISTFRAGCILQGALLEPMTKAFEADPSMPNLLCAFQAEIAEGMPGLRATCARLAMGGEPPLVMQASLGYLTAMVRSTLMAGQVVSLQRDVFGRHGFKRLQDGKATDESYNAEWREIGFPEG
ncbi:unnamed protein product [Prorocentrum cordatum]|uniref:phosphogluconate dehydrogenase (NADP(+)-dependent, decarboxylating) n=1 Tax=Prorocentrum cordatum TaxID=2364126 RepID=A0ABN9UAS0_9DINO|nr:unnamed protein product [Polarella glacialis]